MLKLALLITGTTRNYKENYKTWKLHLLDLYNVDIFFHTYDIIGYHNQLNKNIKFDKNELLEMIKPKKYIIDNFETEMVNIKTKIISHCLRKNSSKPEFILAQLYSIFKANELKKIYEIDQHFTYDIVIKIRFDTIFYSDFVIDDIKTIFKNSNIILCGNPYIKTMKYKTIPKIHGCKHWMYI